MATSLIRSRAAITGVKDRFAWNEIKDGAVLQEDGVIAAIGSFAELSARHPTVRNETGRIDTVTAIALGQRKCDRPVTLTAKPTLKNIKHAEIVGAFFSNENPVVAIAAIQPFSVRAMRKSHNSRAGSLLEKDIEVEQVYLGFRVKVSSGVYGA